MDTEATFPEMQTILSQDEIEAFAIAFETAAKVLNDFAKNLNELWERIQAIIEEVARALVTFFRDLQRFQLRIKIVTVWPGIPSRLLDWLVEIWPDRFLPNLI